MRVKTRAMAAAAVTSLALLAACGGGGGETPGPGASASGGGQAGGEITVRSCTPQNALIPGNSQEQCGNNIQDAMTSKLVHYNPDTAAPELDIAEDITTKDNQNFTVKLKHGYKFHDGTEVKAKNFVDAWNWNSLGENGYLNTYFFEPIEGYADLQCGLDAKGAPDCDGKPAKSKKMSGLKVVDDYTFTIKTSSKVSNLLVRLGYLGFAPLPDSFFSDQKGFETKPIGAGPFKIDSKTDTEVVLSKFADYSGQYKPSIDKVTFKVYNDDGAAYNDVLANSLDFTDQIPSDRLTGDLWKTELDGRNGTRDAGITATTSFSPIDPQFKNTDLRKAISLAIDRDLINKQIFNGTRPPLDGWVSPVVDGFKPGACGEFCKFDPAKAKQLYESSGGYKGTLTLAVNGDGGHGPWAEAACNSIKNTLGLDCQAKITPDFKTIRDQITKRELKGLYRSGWQMDYPSIENFLVPLYGTNAPANDSGYSNPKFDAKAKEAAAASTPDEANKLYQEAEALLVEGFPAIPMWSYTVTTGWSNRVSDVKVTPFGWIDLTSVKVK
jgi:oligopeptide transport system substrate-binding protein